MLIKGIEFSDADLYGLQHSAKIYLAKESAKKKDILTWGKVLFPDKFPLEFCKELHEYFISVRQEEYTNTEAPRFHSKTTVKCFLIPIFQALEEPLAFRHYLNVQATDRKAQAVNVSIRSELERNPELFEIYGEQVGNSKWTDAQFVLKNGVIFTAVGAGQSIRGINYENMRPDYCIVDDLYDEDDINNPESTIRKNEWYLGTLYPAMAVGRKICRHIQGTAINSVDMLEMLKENKRVKSRTFKAIKNESKKEALWPEGKSYDKLLEMREDMGTIIFNREMQNERREDATAIIKRAWIREYDPASINFSTRYMLTGVILNVDPSIGAKEENDYTGIALILKAQYNDSTGSVFYIKNVWEEHLSLDGRIRLMESIAGSCPQEERLTQVRIEAIGGFKDFAEECRRRTALPITEIDHVKDKISNLENKSHFFENGKVLINKNIDSRLKDRLIHQLTNNHPQHDDMRDAVLLGLEDAGANWGFV